MSKIEVVKQATLTGHKDCIYSLEKADSREDFFSAGGDGLVARWSINDPENGELVAKVPSSVYALHYIEKLSLLLVGQNFEGIHAVDIQNKKELKSVKITSAAIFDIKSVGDKLFVATGDGTLLLLNLVTLSVLKAVKASVGSARCIALHPEANILAVGYSDNFIRIYDASNLQLIKEIEAHTKSVFTLTFTPDGQFLLSGSRDAHLKIWNVASGFTLHQSIVAHMYAINHIAYNYNGDYFATCSMDKSIKIWHGKEFKLLKVIDKARHAGHGTSVNKVYWSKIENILVSCSDDRSISIWDLKINQ